MPRTLAIASLLVGVLAVVALGGTLQTRSSPGIPKPFIVIRPPSATTQPSIKAPGTAIIPIPSTWTQRVIPIPTQWHATVRLLPAPGHTNR